MIPGALTLPARPSPGPAGSAASRGRVAAKDSPGALLGLIVFAFVAVPIGAALRFATHPASHLYVF